MALVQLMMTTLCDKLIKSDSIQDTLLFFESELKSWKEFIEAYKLSNDFLILEWMENSRWSNNRGASSAHNTHSWKLIVLPKKGHDNKLIDSFKFELFDKKSHDRLIKRKKGANLKEDNKIFLWKIMIAHCEEHTYIRTLY